MELTPSQLLLLIAFNEAKIGRQEAVAILTLLNRQEIEQVLDKLDVIVEKEKRFATEQEIMNIIWPILKEKN